MKITIVAGARPNFMKIAPIMRAIQAARAEGKDINGRLIYTGSANDNSIDPALFSDLAMPAPDCFLNVSANNFSELTAQIMVAFDKELSEHPTQLVLVVDDLTPTLACSLVAKKRKIKVAHLVAGTRSFDLDTPKEVNSVVTDALSDFLFTAGRVANRNLSQSGTADTNVYFVGNILLDTLRFNRNRFTKPALFSVLGLSPKKYLLLTLNRRALLEHPERLRALLNAVVQKSNGLPIVAPLHTYIREAIGALNIEAANLHILPTQGYLSFGYLLNNALGVITDSGNIAEEATFLSVPCATLNNYAEHPETYTYGTNELVGENAQILATAVEKMVLGRWKEGKLPEQWDGRTAERIIQTLCNILN